MIGKVALTKKKGQLFVITGEKSELGSGDPIYIGISLTQSNKLGEVKEKEPRELCSLMDILDYGKIADQTVKLIHRESEENEDTEVKSLAPMDDLEDDSED